MHTLYSMEQLAQRLFPSSVIVLSFEVRSIPVPEFIDQVFAKTSPKRSFSITKNERFGLVFVKTGSINSGTGKQDKQLMKVN
jgi:hypothetical protein